MSENLKNNIQEEVRTEQETKDIVFRKLKIRQMFIPILIGVGIIGGMLYFQLKGKEIPFHLLEVTTSTVLFLLLSAFFMFMRDIAYITRFKILAENKVSWRQAFRVIMLWEFTSAISPSAIGGTGVAVIFVNKEGISIGKSSSIVMASSFLDELYFIIMFPLIVFSVNNSDLFTTSTGAGISWGNEFFIFALVGFGMKFFYLMFISYGLFKNPELIKRLILKLFGIRILRRWRKGARRAGIDIVKNSDNLKNKPFKYWFKVTFWTFVSWTSRYWVVNALFVAFFVIDKSHILLFARQLVMWIMMLVSPTPGGSGFSEFVFSEYLGDFLPETAGIAIIMAFIWRLFTYYPYLIIGAFVVPRWIKEKFGK